MGLKFADRMDRSYKAKVLKGSERRTPNAELFPSLSLDEALAQIESSSVRKVLFGGEGAGEISSYVAGWMASQHVDVIVLDGANRFDPYAVSSFGRRVRVSPERLLKKIRIARAFTSYQMATLMSEKLAGLLEQEREMTRKQKPWVILLGPITPFLDEDVPEREVGPLLERSLRKLDILAAEGIPLFLFQSSVSPHSKRACLMRRLFQFANLVWRISVGDEGPRVILEKEPTGFQISDRRLQMDNFQTSNNKSQINSKCQFQITQT